jgi:hypothetical protein
LLIALTIGPSFLFLENEKEGVGLSRNTQAPHGTHTLGWSIRPPRSNRCRRSPRPTSHPCEPLEQTPRPPSGDFEFAWPPVGPFWCDFARFVESY